MKPLFVAAVIGPTLVAGGVLMAGDFSATRVASPQSAGASGPVRQAAALTGATFEMGYSSEVKGQPPINFRNGGSNG